MRFPDWRDRLNALRDEKAREPFAWGQWDCARWAAAAVEAITGVDHYAAFRGKYSTDIGSIRAMIRYGQGDLQATTTGLLGEPVHPAFAGDGDIVMSVDGLGVCRGATADFVSDTGFVRVPRKAWLMAWKV